MSNDPGVSAACSCGHAKADHASAREDDYACRLCDCNGYRPEPRESFVNLTKVGHRVQVSREMLLGYGLIEPTDEDRARWALAKAEHDRWRRSFRGRRARLRSWWADHRPTLHFGPCEAGYDD